MPLAASPTAHADQKSRPTHNYITWLDLYPPPPLWPVPHITARIDKVKETLESIKWKIKIRRHVVILAESNGMYCSTCGPLRVAASGSCGASCALHRPEAGSYIARASERDWTRVRRAKKDLECYDTMIKDMNRLGYDVPRRTVLGWEVTAKNLLVGTKDPEPPTRTMRPVSGLNRYWTFASRWGQGSGLKLELTPEVTETSAAARNR